MSISWMPLFPASTTRRLRYSTSFGGATTSGAITSTYIFRANSLYDPDLSSTGHQPMGFDQMMLSYNHFVVLRSKITCVFKNTSTTAPTVCIRLDADSVAVTAIDKIIEFGGAVIDVLESKASYGGTKEMSLLADIGLLQGVKRSAITADSTLRGTAAADPSEITYFHVTMWDTAAASGSMAVDAVIDFEAVFLEPRDLTQSLANMCLDCKAAFGIVPPKRQIVVVEPPPLFDAPLEVKECKTTPVPDSSRKPLARGLRLLRSA